MKRFLSLLLFLCLYIGSSYATIVVEKIWETNTNLPAQADCKQGVGWDGKFYIQDKTNSKIYLYEKGGTKTDFATSGAGYGIAVDDAGNLLVRTNFYTPAALMIYRKGSSSGKTISFTLDDAAATYYVTATGDIFSEEGGYAYFFCNGKKVIHYAKIVNGALSSVGTIGTDVGTANSALGYVVTDPDGNYYAQDRSNFLNKWNGSTKTSISTPSTLKKSTSGGCFFKIGSHLVHAYNYTGKNYTSEWKLYDRNASVEIPSSEVLYAINKTTTNTAYANWLNYQRIDAYTGYIYQYCPNVGIACWKVYDTPPTLSDAMEGKTIRRSVYYDGHLYVLAVDCINEPYLYKVNAETQTIAAILPTNFCSVSNNGYYKLSDIAITADGTLIGCNNEHCTTGKTAGQYLKFYKWDLSTLTGAEWFSADVVATTGDRNPAAGNFVNASSGATMAYNGTLANGTISWRAQTTGSANGKTRPGYATIVDGAPTYAMYSQDNSFLTAYDNVEFAAAPTSGHFIFMSDTQAPLEFSAATIATNASTHGTFAITGVHSISFLTIDETKYMAVPSAEGVKIYDITSGLASAELVHTFTQANTATFRYAAAVQDAADLVVYFQTDGTITKLTATGFFPATAESITLNESTIYLPVGGTFTLTPSILPVEASGNTITWTTGNSSIATVSEGVVTAVAVGSTTITAEVDGETATCTVNVCAPVAHILPYELRRTDNGNGTYTFTFKSNTSATSGKIIFYQNGVKKGEVAIASSITAGANEVIIAKSALPQIEGVMTWSVELTGAENKVLGLLSNDEDKFRFYNLRGISANIYPDTEGFGNIYVNMALNGSSDGTCERTKTQTKGIFQFDAAMNLKNSTNAGYTGGISWPNSSTAPFRTAVGEDGLLYVSGDHASFAGVWVLDNPDASSGTFQTVINGIQEQGLCITGTGSQKKLYTIEKGSSANIMKYSIGTNIPYTGDGVLISTGNDAKIAYSSSSYTNIATDGNGGLWLYQYRYAETSDYPCLVHLNVSGSLDYDSHRAELGITNNTRGGFAINSQKNLLACGTGAKVIIYSVGWNGSGAPVLTKLYDIPINGTNIDCITFDYADNIYIGTSSTEYLYVYALPTANNTTEVPAMSSLTVEAFDHIDVSSVTINEGAQSIERGNTFTFSATVLPADASDPSLTWASDNTSVATVNETTGEVTAVEVGTAHITATADGVTSVAVTVTVFKLDYDVTWEPNGATIKTTAPASNNDLWTQFMTDYNAYYGLSRAVKPITDVRAFLNNTHCIDFITNPASPWCWLGEIIIPAAEAAGRTLDSEMKCGFDIYAFFNQLPETSGTYGYGDYTIAGQIENWLPLWKEANNYLPPTMRATDEMPVIRKGNYLLAGWYDNSSFTGAPVTSVTADITLYAKWIEPIELDEASADNITKIEDNDGKLANVILRRTFEATGYWYTLVLPFDVSAEQMEETFGAGYEVTVLESSYRKSETVIYLKFVPQTYIKAGEPCLFKPGRDTDEAIFRGVTIDNTTPEVNTTIVNMVGLYAPTVVTLSDNNYYLGSTNYLHEYVAMYQNTKGFRAYFHFNEAMAAGCSARVVFREDTATELEDLPEVNTPAVQKVIRDGQLIIIREGKEYTTQGQLIQ